MKVQYSIISMALGSLCWVGCATEPEPGDFVQSTGYRSGHVNDEYLSNGERGNVSVTEIMWAGSVRGEGEVYDPDDVFIELQNKHPRPIHLTNWQLTIEAGHQLDGMLYVPRSQRSAVTYVLPLRRNRQPLETNEMVVIAAKRDGAYADVADYFIEDLRIPDGPFEIVIKDLDERLIDHVGDDRKPPFAGAWDGYVARSMERIQLIFNNRGNRESAWHSYSLNDFDVGSSEPERGAYHRDLRVGIRDAFKARTFATPGQPNSPDYSGSTSTGSFE